MTTTYRLKEDELSMDLINSIRSAFKNKTIEITVTELVDETDFLLSSVANKSHLEESENALKEGQGVTFTVNELQEKYGAK
ncbi:MAG: hypothetical protein H0U39_02880 [Segetibacter sp.]|jgi:hypothetical protein|nr:hypothetical protein [Segetibacter sp.]